MVSPRRLTVLLISFFLLFTAIVGRLFYWQILVRERLVAEAESQQQESLEISASRGQIKTVDDFPLAANQIASLVFANLPQVEDVKKTSRLLSPLLEIEEASLSASLGQNLVWVPLKHKVEAKVLEKIRNLNLAGIGFEREDKRFYPEASSAAHLLGFVGSDIYGKDKGYFGLEGYYDRELKGRPGILWQEKDAKGRPILLGKKKLQEAEDGRNLILYLDRSVQFIVEENLKKGLEKYGAKAGSVVLMEPKTGGILSMASFPSYDPATYFEFEKERYKNPVVADAYEPGSSFKVIVMAAALNEGLVKPTTIYEDRGPVKIGEYTIRTWNNKYHDKETMTQILEHSCNVGMVFVAQKLGMEKILKYLEDFGFGKETKIDLEEESSPDLRPRKDWKEIDLATASFGQGIAVTAIQMVRAVAAIANEGRLMEPHVVQKVISPQGRIMEIKSKVIRQVIKPSTTKVLTEMMVAAVDNGEAKWAKPAGFRIAGKTGTAQIPLAGHYDEKRTIASFVGFAPADNPAFVMLVRLVEPTSSPWGSETAAPLFFDITKELFTYWGIPPGQ